MSKKKLKANAVYIDSNIEMSEDLLTKFSEKLGEALRDTFKMNITDKEAKEVLKEAVQDKEDGVNAPYNDTVN
jgi:hypothetical protein